MKYTTEDFFKMHFYTISIHVRSTRCLKVEMYLVITIKYVYVVQQYAMNTFFFFCEHGIRSLHSTMSYDSHLGKTSEGLAFAASEVRQQDLNKTSTHVTL